MPDRLAAEAQERGISLELYVEELLAQQSIVSEEQTNQESINEAVDRIRELRKHNALGGHRIRDLIHEGHKYWWPSSLWCLASVTLAWYFPDEQTDRTHERLERLTQGDRVIVPAHWPTEVANAFLMGVRKKRIEPEQPPLLWDQLDRLAIETEPALTTVEVKEVLALGEKHGLAVYDAAYLDLARSRQLPLATLDGDLRKAAQSESVELL